MLTYPCPYTLAVVYMTAFQFNRFVVVEGLQTNRTHIAVSYYL